jgi:hypothetical protein
MFDTIEGIQVCALKHEENVQYLVFWQGYIRLQIKVEFFGDENPWKDSAAGVLIFSVSDLEGYIINEVHGEWLNTCILFTDLSFSFIQVLLKSWYSRVIPNITGVTTFDLQRPATQSARFVIPVVSSIYVAFDRLYLLPASVYLFSLVCCLL